MGMHRKAAEHAKTNSGSLNSLLFAISPLLFFCRSVSVRVQSVLVRVSPCLPLRHRLPALNINQARGDELLFMSFDAEIVRLGKRCIAPSLFLLSTVFTAAVFGAQQLRLESPRPLANGWMVISNGPFSSTPRG